MFGFGRTERATKRLESALRIFLPGDPISRRAIIERSAEDSHAAARDIAAGADPFQAGAVLASRYIRGELAKLEPDSRQRILRAISNKRPTGLPAVAKFAIHLCLVLAKLEAGDKPLVPPGTTANYLDSVAEAFSNEADMKKRIAAHLYTCATQPVNADKAAE